MGSPRARVWSRISGGSRTRRDAAHLGWYFRDLRAPARIWRLDVDEALEALAEDRRRPAAAWTADAERLRALTMALALRRAEGLLGETLDLPELEHRAADAVATPPKLRAR